MEALNIFFVLHRTEVTNFVSFYFLIFVILSVFAFYLFKRSTIILLLSGLAFYAAYSISMAKLLLLLTFVNYVAGLLINKNKSKILLLGIVAFDVGALIYFRYVNFFLENVHNVNFLNSVDIINYIVIPLGISFFTFEFIHYTVDVYRGKRYLKNPIKFFTFIFFFPTLIAGPIKRFEQFIPQLKQKKTNYSSIQHGILLLVRGLFKKIVIANSVASFVSYGFDYSSNSTMTLIGIYAFAIQIYFDFSGYTDIARGCAYLFGIEVPENFLSPYKSVNIRDFWRRWHITLMQWLRDYVYIPLGGSRKGKIRNIVNIFVVFILSGLWHGASWNFLIWGLYHGSLVSISTLRNKKKKTVDVGIKKILGIFITFNLVTIGWIFFRATNLDAAIEVFRKLFTLSDYHSISSVYLANILVILFVLLIYTLRPIFLSRIKDKKLLYKFVYYGSYSIALTIVMLLLPYDTKEFIYFQF